MVLKNNLIDIVLIVFITIFAFGLAYHPYFFGDEMVVHKLAIHNSYSFASIFQGLNSYKPRLVFNAIEALLGKYQASRLVHAELVTGSMVLVNIFLYISVRFFFKASRAIALLLIATVLSSRYGMMFYFDYVSGLIELLSTALLLSILLLAYFALQQGFKWWYALGALIFSILIIFVHERYVAGLFATGCAIAIAEWVGSSAKKRYKVVVWAISLSIIPLFLFWIANKTLGTLSITTGTSGQKVALDRDAFWCMLTYSYNVFMGGNYGHDWFWGYYNYLHPVGKFMGWATVLCTVVTTSLIVLRKGLVWGNRWLGLSLLAAAVAFIVIASLVGSTRQEARFMFPVGILITMILIVMLKGAWRYLAISIILAINMMYLLLESHDSIYNVTSSRLAHSVAGSLLGIMPNGRRGILVGINEEYWPIVGSDMLAGSDVGPKLGAAFSKVNLNSRLQIDPFVVGHNLDPALYDFGLAFNGFGPHRTARYRIVSVDTALILAGVSDVDKLPIHSVIGNKDSWLDWLWNIKPNNINDAIVLRPGTAGWKSMPVSDLDGRWLVYRARVSAGEKTPMRLQVNWHSKSNNQFLSTSIEVVYPNATWHSYATLLSAPLGADIGYIYLNLHDGAQGEVELQSVELK